ncbi:MAG: inositol monophosphatase family protein [Bacteroidia bacterium]
MNYQEICLKVCDIAKQAVAFIRAERNKIAAHQVEVKSLNSLVTYVDKTSEKMLVEALQQLLPEAGFITEEETINNKNENLSWIIDPLDGTTNFIHGVPCFSVSIALMANGEVVIGVIYEINLDECFYAWKNGGAFLNGTKINVTTTKNLSDTLLATGFPYYDYERMQPYLNLLAELMEKTRGIRRLGSAATDLAYVACGRFDAFYEYSLHAWDVAAGALIVQEAGGKVSDFKGGNDYIFGKEINASNGFIHQELSDIISKNFH